MAKEYKPGIYFGMPFEEYCQIDALNTGGIKKLLVSGHHYWTYSQMNPYREEIDDETRAKIDGRAYHKRILEGAEAFYKVYAPAFEVDPLDRTILTTNDEIEYALIKLGLGGTFKTKAAGAARLMSANPKARIKFVMEEQHRAQYPDREFVSQKLIRHIEFTNKSIQANPEVNTWLAGGYPEVTVIWYDEEFGVLMKCRFDYLKMTHGTDLKSYANQRDKNIEKAIMDIIATYKYFIQAALYMRGQDAARLLAAEGMVYGEVDKKWLRLFSESETVDFRFLFVEKGETPHSQAAVMLKGSDFDKHGIAHIRQAVNVYHQNMNFYGKDLPWFNRNKPMVLQLDEMPQWGNDL